MNNILLPPWIMYDYPCHSLGWRMGAGEDYMIKWRKWFENKSQAEQEVYTNKYPAPDNEWEMFYERVVKDE